MRYCSLGCVPLLLSRGSLVGRAVTVHIYFGESLPLSPRIWRALSLCLYSIKPLCMARAYLQAAHLAVHISFGLAATDPEDRNHACTHGYTFASRGPLPSATSFIQKWRRAVIELVNPVRVTRARGGQCVCVCVFMCVCRWRCRGHICVLIFFPSPPCRLSAGGLSNHVW